ncbi:MAG: DNA recombination protein RmuC [Candidatus Edwardsbacteria bacterium]
MQIMIMAALVILMIVAFWFFARRMEKRFKESLESQKNEQALQLISQWMTETKGTLEFRLNEVRTSLDRTTDTLARQMDSTNKTLNERLDNASKVIGEVQRNLGEMTKETERMREIGKDIAKLSEILAPPKLRGKVGEFLLSELLSQILPRTYFSLQYKFKSGEPVDAVIHLGEGMVPVDAKFPLENFRKMLETSSEEERKNWRREFIKDVKKRIDETAKYIMPDEGTFDFVLMYIPAENVYYETIIKDESFGEDKSLLNYALGQHVIPVSPNSFYAYLQAILLGLRGLHVEESAKEIISSLSRLDGDLAKFREDFETMGRHLANAKNKYEEAERKLDRFQDRLTNIEEHKPIETQALQNTGGQTPSSLCSQVEGQAGKQMGLLE